MKKRFLFFGLGLFLFIGGCSKVYRCEYSIPADMEEYVPDMKGMTYVYVNASNDTVGMVGGNLITNPSKPFDIEDQGGGFVCSSNRVFPFYSIDCEYPNYSGYECLEVRINRYISDGNYSEMWMDLSTQKPFPGTHFQHYFVDATFDEQGHFVTRDFGDTLVLTKKPRVHDDVPDTALWVRGLGIIRLNDYRLVSVTDSTGDVFYSAEAK